MNNEIQSCYWKSVQISIFTAVCYCGNEPQSFALVSDDTKHDSAHALFAINHIIQSFKNSRIESIQEITLITDGAPSHFKNRYQFHEFSKLEVNKKLIFSATGHGKGIVFVLNVIEKVKFKMAASK